MSKIRELIEKEFISLLAVYDPQKEMDVGDFCDYTNEVSKQVEQAIKAEIMGLKPIKYLGNGSTSANGKYNDNFHPMTQTSGEPQHINRSDLENLFKESE